jgi:hypothetical protein
LTHGEIVGTIVGIERETERGELRDGAFVNRSTANARSNARLVSEREILGDAHGSDQVQVLMDHSHTACERICWVSKTYWVAIELNRAGIGSHGAAQNLDERAFTCSVFTTKRVDLAGVHVEIDAA